MLGSCLSRLWPCAWPKRGGDTAAGSGHGESHVALPSTGPATRGSARPTGAGAAVIARGAEALAGGAAGASLEAALRVLQQSAVALQVVAAPTGFAHSPSNDLAHVASLADWEPCSEPVAATIAFAEGPNVPAARSRVQDGRSGDSQSDQPQKQDKGREPSQGTVRDAGGGVAEGPRVTAGATAATQHPAAAAAGHDATLAAAPLALLDCHRELQEAKAAGLGAVAAAATVSTTAATADLAATEMPAALTATRAGAPSPHPAALPEAPLPPPTSAPLPTESLEASTLGQILSTFSSGPLPVATSGGTGMHHGGRNNAARAAVRASTAVGSVTSTGTGGSVAYSAGGSGGAAPFWLRNARTGTGFASPAGGPVGGAATAASASTGAALGSQNPSPLLMTSRVSSMNSAASTRTNVSRPSRWGLKSLAGLVSSGLRSLSQRLARIAEPGSGSLRPDAVLELARTASRMDMLRGIAQVTDLEIISQGAARSVVYRGHIGGLCVCVKFIVTSAAAGPDGMAASATEGLLSRVLVHPNVVRTYGWHLTRVAEEDVSSDLAAALAAADERRRQRRRRRHMQRKTLPPLTLTKQRPGGAGTALAPVATTLAATMTAGRFSLEQRECVHSLRVQETGQQASSSPAATASLTSVPGIATGGASGVDGAVPGAGCTGTNGAPDANREGEAAAAVSRAAGTSTVTGSPRLAAAVVSGATTAAGVTAAAAGAAVSPVPSGSQGSPASETVQGAVVDGGGAVAGVVHSGTDVGSSGHPRAGSSGAPYVSGSANFLMSEAPTTSTQGSRPFMIQPGSTGAGSGDSGPAGSGLGDTGCGGGGSGTTAPNDASPGAGGACTAPRHRLDSVATAPDAADGAGAVPTATPPSTVQRDLSRQQLEGGWRKLQEILQRLNARPGDFLTRIVMEDADRGSLLTAIREGAFSGEGGPGLTRLLLTALDVARGMAHLHANTVIHGDLKPSNVLLRSENNSRGWVALVSDFGLSRIAPRGSLETPEPSGTVAYMAPEVVTGNRYPSSDVYSYGVLLWQMASGAPPWPGLRAMQILMGILTGELRLSPPDRVFRPLASLMAACLAHAHEERPSFHSIAETLQAMLQDLGPQIETPVDALAATQPPDAVLATFGSTGDAFPAWYAPPADPPAALDTLGDTTSPAAGAAAAVSATAATAAAPQASGSGLLLRQQCASIEPPAPTRGATDAAAAQPERSAASTDSPRASATSAVAALPSVHSCVADDVGSEDLTPEVAGRWDTRGNRQFNTGEAEAGAEEKAEVDARFKDEIEAEVAWPFPAVTSWAISGGQGLAASADSAAPWVPSPPPPAVFSDASAAVGIGVVDAVGGDEADLDAALPMPPVPLFAHVNPAAATQSVNQAHGNAPGMLTASMSYRSSAAGSGYLTSHLMGSRSSWSASGASATATSHLAALAPASASGELFASTVLAAAGSGSSAGAGGAPRAWRSNTCGVLDVAPSRPGASLGATASASVSTSGSTHGDAGSGGAGGGDGGGGVGAGLGSWRGSSASSTSGLTSFWGQHSAPRGSAGHAELLRAGEEALRARAGTQIGGSAEGLPRGTTLGVEAQALQEDWYLAHQRLRHTTSGVVHVGLPQPQRQQHLPPPLLPASQPRTIPGSEQHAPVGPALGDGSGLTAALLLPPIKEETPSQSGSLAGGSIHSGKADQRGGGSDIASAQDSQGSPEGGSGARAASQGSGPRHWDGGGGGINGSTARLAAVVTAAAAAGGASAGARFQYQQSSTGWPAAEPPPAFPPPTVPPQAQRSAAPQPYADDTSSDLPGLLRAGLIVLGSEFRESAASEGPESRQALLQRQTQRTTAPTHDDDYVSLEGGHE